MACYGGKYHHWITVVHYGLWRSLLCTVCLTKKWKKV